MELVEIRDLDGPNLFALEPVIKLEVSIDSDEEVPVPRQQYIAEHTNLYVSSDPVQALVALINGLHGQLKIPAPRVQTHDMDTANHISICFSWEHRARARAIARTAFELVAGERIERLSTHLISAIEAETDEDEPVGPTWVRDTERRIPAAAITGTNGKTTTTRLLAHILRSSGKRVGWSSSSGVYIEGEMVIDGDYTGHGGARRVLTDPEIDCAVLETARGGILLRGLGYESNDVSVFLNVSEDHLNLHGVEKLETLAWVKATVSRTTRPDGVAVLNADDPLVLAQLPHVRAEVILTTQHPDNPTVREHIDAGGRCVLLESETIKLHNGGHECWIIPISEVPLTYGGMARHMIENTLAACAAAIGMGVDMSEIRSALKDFHPDSDHNAGRLNVFEIDDVTIVVDFAHNESGLSFLLDFGRQLVPSTSRLTAIIGTAGDRQDSVFVRLGEVAGSFADQVLIKSNPNYLRGRSHEQTVGLMEQGLAQVNASDRCGGIYLSEFDAAVAAVEHAQPGELIVVMCVEDYPKIVDHLDRRGARERKPASA
ncbi:MAG: Mur ligase family protein [Thermomicrobiaceae bacterium]